MLLLKFQNKKRQQFFADKNPAQNQQILF